MPASQLYQASVTLNDAQIKGLPSTPVVIVPPTEILNYTGSPTQLFVPVFALVRTANLAVPYSNINASCATFVNLGSDNSFTYSGPLPGGDYLQQNGAMFINPTPGFNTGAAAGADITAYFNNLNDSLLDNAICLAVNNQGDGDFTGGDPANVMKVTVSYLAITV